MTRPLSHLLLITTLLCPAAFAQTAPAGASTPPAAEAVTLAPLAQAVVRPAREAPASVVARNESRLAAEASGTVQAWRAELGETVRRGQVLVQLDPRDAELAQQRARAALASAEAWLALAQS